MLPISKGGRCGTPIITGGKYELISARYGKYAAEPGDYYHDMFRWGNQRRSQGNMEAIWTFEMEYNRDVNGVRLTIRNNVVTGFLLSINWMVW